MVSQELIKESCSKMNKGQKKNNKNGEIKTELVFKPSAEANFRLFKSLGMLLSEDDIYKFFKNYNYAQRRKNS